MEGENVSHNTSYSETSPNVHDVDEELMETGDQNHYQGYTMQQPYSDMGVITRYIPGESQEIPNNISNSEIEEMNYTMNPAFVNQLT